MHANTHGTGSEGCELTQGQAENSPAEHAPRQRTATSERTLGGIPQVDELLAAPDAQPMATRLQPHPLSAVGKAVLGRLEADGACGNAGSGAGSGEHDRSVHEPTRRLRWRAAAYI